MSGSSREPGLRLGHVVLAMGLGQEARHRTLSEGDKQLQAALNLFDRAATMMAQRQELGTPNPRIPRADESPKGRL